VHHKGSQPLGHELWETPIGNITEGVRIATAVCGWICRTGYSPRAFSVPQALTSSVAFFLATAKRCVHAADDKKTTTVS
jgi:hypothetical protein